MSKLVESLRDQMRSIFGDSFGQTVEPVSNLSEAIETELSERKDGKRKVAKQRGGDFAPNVKAQKFGDDHERSTRARIKKNMAAFFRHADKEAAKSAQRPRPEKLDPRHGAGQERKVVSKSSGGGGGGGQHNPFKHSPNLGTGPGTPPGFHPVHGKRHHDERKCWNCSCGNVYEKGCTCIGTGATKDCPKGHEKHVQIHKAYRHAYNDMYHAWRRGDGSHTNRKGKWSGPRRGD